MSSWCAGCGTRVSHNFDDGIVFNLRPLICNSGQASFLKFIWRLQSGHTFYLWHCWVGEWQWWGKTERLQTQDCIEVEYPRSKKMFPFSLVSYWIVTVPESLDHDYLAWQHQADLVQSRCPQPTWWTLSTWLNSSSGFSLKKGYSSPMFIELLVFWTCKNINVTLKVIKTDLTSRSRIPCSPTTIWLIFDMSATLDQRNVPILCTSFYLYISCARDK